MRPARLLATVITVLVLAATAGASTDAVSVTVRPRTALTGERLTISARPRPGAMRCSGRITRPATRAAVLPARRPVRGSAVWKWAVPITAKSGAATAGITCGKTGAGSARFAIRALPVGDASAGKTVFLLNCGGCHTLADAGTQGTSVDLDAASPSYATIVDRVVNGKRLMPSFKGRLTPQQMADVATYVSTVAGS